MTLVLYAAILILGSVSYRVFLIGARGGFVPEGLVETGIITLGAITVLSMFIWGFASLIWYWPPAFFLLGVIIAALTVTRSTWLFWYGAKPIIDMLIIAAFSDDEPNPRLN